MSMKKIKMWRLGGLLGRKTKTWMRQSKAGYKYWVMNETLKQLTKDCYIPCCVPRGPPQKVTVMGAGSDVGRIASFMLKQQPIVKILSLYDDHPENNVIGVGTDIAHIDTSTLIQAYQGRKYANYALCDADVVLICGGCYPYPPNCCLDDYELFMENMTHVRSAVTACAFFCPFAIIAIQTPPVEANVTLAKYFHELLQCGKFVEPFTKASLYYNTSEVSTLKRLQLFNPRKLIGLNAIHTMRMNQLFSRGIEKAPENSYVPIIGGASRCTRVPVFSANKLSSQLKQEDKDFIMRVLREGDELICRVKSNYEQAHLSIGFATARAITTIMNGIFVKPSFLDSAVIHQPDKKMTYGQKIFATPVTVGRDGIEKIEMPKLDAYEQKVLDACLTDIIDLTNLGKCHGIGDRFKPNLEKHIKPTTCIPCPVCRPRNERKECKDK